MELKEESRTNVKVNLHGSEITSPSANGSDPDMIHFYRKGTADKLGLKEDKNAESMMIFFTGF